MAHHSHSRIALRWVHWIMQLRWVVLGLWYVEELHERSIIA